MSAQIEVDGFIATYDQGRWSSSEPALTYLCEVTERLLPSKSHEYYPYPTEGIAKAVAAELGGRLIHCDEPPHIDYPPRNKILNRKAFLAYRTKPGEKPQLLRELTGNPGYGDTEIAIEDDFAKRGGSHYSGKMHANSTEILTTGIVRLHHNPSLFERTDPEYFHFVIDTLRGY